MDIHLVLVPEDVDVVNATRKPAKGRERPAFFSVHVNSYVKRGTKFADAQKTEISVYEDGDFGELKNTEIPSKRRRVGRYDCEKRSNFFRNGP